jgi:hypothetical protein
MNAKMRRDQHRVTLPISRIVGPADVAAIAVHVMTNKALTGATHDVDCGRQIVSGFGASPPADSPPGTPSHPKRESEVCR